MKAALASVLLLFIISTASAWRIDRPPWWMANMVLPAASMDKPLPTADNGQPMWSGISPGVQQQVSRNRCCLIACFCSRGQLAGSGHGLHVTNALPAHFLAFTEPMHTLPYRK